AALIHEHDAIAPGIEEAAHLGVGATPGAAMQEHRGLAARITALLVVQLVAAGDLQIPGRVGSQGWVQRTQGARAAAACRAWRGREHEGASPGWNGQYTAGSMRLMCRRSALLSA